MIIDVAFAAGKGPSRDPPPPGDPPPVIHQLPFGSVSAPSDHAGFMVAVAKIRSRMGSFVEANAPESAGVRSSFLGLSELFDPVSVSTVLMCDCSDLCARV